MARRVVFLAFPDFQVLDLTGPLEVFAMANRLAEGEPPYATDVVTWSGGPVRASCGLEVVTRRAGPAIRAPIDTLVVVGGVGVAAAMDDDRLIRWVRSAARRSRRVTSVCSGSFLLGAAGLLDGRQATTHWSACDRLARAFPQATVEPDPIFVRDGDVWTSAGVTAGIDLCLALVEDDLGAEVARSIARWLVVFLQRPGGQSQFSHEIATPLPSQGRLRDLQAWIADHLDTDLSVTALAARSGISVRHFSRAFRADTGTTPAAYVEAVRVEAARRFLESSEAGVAAIARRTGFGTPETMHRAFRRIVGVTPGEYRSRFG